MRSQCHTWHAAPAIATEYLEVVRQFAMNEQMHLWAEGYVHGHAGRLLWDVEFLLSHYRFTSCLNVGGAPFLFEYLIAKYKKDVSVVTLDIDVTRFPRASEVLGTKMVQVDIERADPQSISAIGQFGCVVFCEVFEHLRIDILRTMKMISSLIAPEGVLYLTMPNGLGLAAWVNRLTKGRTGPEPVSEWRKLSEIGHMGHVREYSAREVQEVFLECGLNIERYFFRRQSAFHGTFRSRIRDAAQLLATHCIPSLGDEVVVIARRAEKSIPLLPQPHRISDRLG